MRKNCLILFIVSGFMMIQFFSTGISAQNTNIQESPVQELISTPLRIRAADVIYSHDDLFYEGYWEVRENYVHTVIYYTTSFSLSGYSYEDVTTIADQNAGLTRTRTYYHYNIN